MAREGQEREGADDHGEVVGRHHPRDARDRRLQVDEELGQGQDDDRRVGKGNRDRDRERDLEGASARWVDGLGLDGGSLRAKLEPDARLVLGCPVGHNGTLSVTTGTVFGPGGGAVVRINP